MCARRCAGGPCLVVGLARSGVAAARAPARRAGEVIGCDAGAARGCRAAAGGAPRRRRARARCDARPRRGQEPRACRARRRWSPPRASAGCPVLGELELAWRLLPNAFVAVTGTNGKTTTTELLGHIHREARAAGRGRRQRRHAAQLARRATLARGATVVCEVSSFQLEDTDAFAPEAAVLLNLAADHLDRHGTLRGLPRRPSCAIFARQGDDDVAVAPLGARRRGPRRLRAARVLRRRARRRARASAPARCGGDGEPLLARRRARACAAPHNRANAMAAAAVVPGARGRAPTRCAPALRTLRRRRAPPRGGRRRSTASLYVNDSKATNVASTLVALDAFDGGVHLILGGQGKGAGLRAAARRRSRARCAGVYLIGEDGRAHRARLDGRAAARCGDLERAVAAARAAARPGEVVLLSPACASFDQFDDFEARGRALQGAWCAERRSQALMRAAAPTTAGPRRTRPKRTRSSTRCCSPRRSACSPLGAVMVYSASSRAHAAAGPGRRHRPTSCATCVYGARRPRRACTSSSRRGLERRAALTAPLLVVALRAAWSLVLLPGRRRRGQRRAPLARRRAAAVPALRAR